MSIPYALERTAHWSGSRVKFVTCEQCGTEYVYRMERLGSGSGTSFLFLDNAGAKERAELEAKHKVNTQLEAEQDPIPCPSCAWVQSGMIPHARQQYHAWMMLLGAAAIGIGLIFPLMDLFMGEFYFLNPSDPYFLPKIAAIPAGLTSIVMRELLARRYDPNAVDLAVRQRIAAQRAIPREKYDALVQAAQPSRQKHWPQFDSSRVVWERTVDGYRVVLEDEIQPKRGMIYKHILRVYSLAESELQLCITASRNEFAGMGKDGSDAHFLRVFSGYEQENLGASPDWGDITKFESRALELVQEHWSASIHSSP